MVLKMFKNILLV